MTASSVEKRSWQETLRAFLHPRVITMLFFGFSAGLPLLLIFGTLVLWLGEADIKLSTVTYFSWAALAYSFKFIWAPLIDRMPVPLLTRILGRRRAWILVAQCSIITAILWMASTDPHAGAGQLTMMALAAVLLGFSSATQDIVIDAYRIESAETDLQALMAATYIAGYRIGMLVAGAGALFLAFYFGSKMGSYNYQAWRWTYSLMALTMLVGVVTTLVIDEPDRDKEDRHSHTTRDYLGFLGMFLIAVTVFILTFYFSSDNAKEVKGILGGWFGNQFFGNFVVDLFRLDQALVAAGIAARLAIMSALVNEDMVRETYIEPVRDFFRRYGTSLAWLLLTLVGFYRISDIVLGVIANAFFQDLGFTKPEIATVVKTFGLFMTLLGGFLGGVLSVRYGVMRILFLGALMTVATNLLYLLLASSGHDIFILYFVISADNLTAGLASAVFIAFLSSLTNISFTAVQYAIFSSLMTLLPKVIGGYSGTIVEGLGYPNFFIIASLMGVPVLVLVWAAARRFEVKQRES